MKRQLNIIPIGSVQHWPIAACITLLAAACAWADDEGEGLRLRQLNLVSDQAGVAQLQDTNLINAWGVSFSASSPFWVSDNGSALATLYAVTNDSTGKPIVSKVGLEVSIPGEGNVTGQLFNNTTAFHTNVFIFASEDGTISGWRGTLGTTAEILTSRSGAVYKGIALATGSNGPVLLAANFAEATLDEYDANFNLVQFADPHAPAGFAPFNVENIHGVIFVTYAMQDPDKMDDVAGRGHGLINTFDLQTGAFHRFATGSAAGGRLTQIDSPWGMALAPATFGSHADQLLVGNFGSGTIMTFDADGRFHGLLQNQFGQPVRIDGLWDLTFGNGGRAGNANTLFFTAGPDGEAHGLFGALVKVKNSGDNNDQGENNQGNQNNQGDNSQRRRH